MTSDQDLIRITITYGYDVHSLEIEKRIYSQILKGEEVELDGQGFSIEGKVVQDFWRFGSGTLNVYCDDGFEVFDGNLSDAITNVEEVTKRS